MTAIKHIYRVIRSVLFSAILIVVCLYILAYVALMLPFVQNSIRDVAEREVSRFLATDVKIGSLRLSPFSQAVLDDVSIPSPDGKKCVDIGRLGAGISLYELISNRKIVITYAEIIGLNATIYQQKEGEPFNIQFIIEALKPKQPGKPPTKFDLKIRNVIIRKMSASFDKEWKPRQHDRQKIDFNHLSVRDMRLDVTLPRISNNEYIIDLRRLSLKEKSGLELRKVTMVGRLTPTELSVKNIEIELPHTTIRPSDIALSFESLKDIGNALKNGRHSLKLANNSITPADFAPFLPALRHFTEPILLSLDVAGSREQISVRQMMAATANERLRLDIKGDILNPMNVGKLRADVSRLRLSVTATEMSRIINYLSPLPENVNNILSGLGEISLDVDGRYLDKNLTLNGIIKTSPGNLVVKGAAAFPSEANFNIKGRITTDGFDVARILPQSGLGRLIFDIDTDLAIADRDINGNADALIDLIEYKGKSLSNIALNAKKNGRHVAGKFSIDDLAAIMSGEADVILGGASKTLKATAEIKHFEPAALDIPMKIPLQSVSGNMNADLTLRDTYDLLGILTLSDVNINDISGRTLTLDNLHLDSSRDEEGYRTILLNCDYLDGTIKGNFHPARLPGIFQSMLAKVLPAYINAPRNPVSAAGENLALRFNIHNDNTLTEFFRLPVRLLTEIPIMADFDGASGIANLDIDVPYIQQGKDKLVRNTRLQARLDDSLGSASVQATTLLPNKNGDIRLNLSAGAMNDNLTTDIEWKFDRPRKYDGKIRMLGALRRNSETGATDVEARIEPSLFHVNDAVWNVAPARISYSDKLVAIDNLRVSHEHQFVDINGRASASDADTLSIALNDIDLDYIFETLNINYVTFGGTATGLVKATSAFTSHPVAFTDGLYVKQLSYNDAVLGDAALTSSWDNEDKLVRIRADIDGGKGRSAIVDGGIWVTRDSLSFDLDADKVNIKFLQPFMAAFCSDVEGMASGKAKLYGTFSDIDLVGRLFADTIRMKLDYTNTWYAGSDSVYLDPGHIRIPSFRLYDTYGHSALFSGWLKHRYFHEPSFEFTLRDADRLLCYDTNEKINPDWYGRIFGSGGATIKGKPGMVDILVDMTTSAGSSFTFVVSDTEAAADYKFLTFSDRHKEQELAAMPDTTPDFIKAFHKRVEQQLDIPSAFNLDLRATVTPQAQVILVMDPVAGDRIKARGNGALQIGYSSESDEMTMYGKYVVDEGNYNFTLQDLIIKDFTIRQGSSVSFHGDPLQATLDIAAAYRVNTNLTDLDPSFASDRDLNRTNVPVEALLLVKGDLESPDISFDIALPTLTSDIERKVRSIISTEDMMTRQIIYLLALNRFYAPEYMNSGSNGGEFASVASATLSSQISNMLGELSDNWQIAPSFRSDKGDFSDMEVDVTLATRLFNNRLLINGNLGYRDKSTSTTTFVGDFDIEYLLNRSGNLRLKAYNHYNDQNYYLKSALTTQGIGIVYRHDFNNPFSWFHRLKDKLKRREEEKAVPAGQNVKNQQTNKTE